MEKEMEEIQKKYEKLSKPIFEEQEKIICGTRGPLDEEVKEAGKYLTVEENGKLSELLKPKAIEGYWLKAMKNNEILNEEIKEKDQDCLKHITSMKYNLIDDSDDFEIIFTFSANDYFTNTELKVKFIMIDDEECEKSEGTKIDWKENKNLTVKKVKKT